MRHEIEKNPRRLTDLVRRCREQDERAWAEFHRWFRGLAARVLSGFPNLTQLEREEAEDAARVAMALQISEGGVAADSDGGVVGYARAVVANAARDVWRRRRPTEPIQPDLSDETPGPALRAAWAAELETLERLVAGWSTEDRFIFVMKLNGVATSAIKADLERLYGRFVTTQAIDVRFHRLRARLGRSPGSADDR